MRKILLFLDTETTGLGKNAMPYEIGITATNEDGKVLADFNENIKVSYQKFVGKKTKEMFEKHHKYSDLKGWQDGNEVINKLVAFLNQFEGDELTVICHNADYDMRIVQNFLKSHKRLRDVFNKNGGLNFSWVCTMFTLRALKALGKWNSGCKLDHVREFLNIKDRAHTALADTKVTARLWFEIVKPSLG